MACKKHLNAPLVAVANASTEKVPLGLLSASRAQEIEIDTGDINRSGVAVTPYGVECHL
jgi:hypothetical protein